VASLQNLEAAMVVVMVVAALRLHTVTEPVSTRLLPATNTTNRRMI